MFEVGEEKKNHFCECLYSEDTQGRYHSLIGPASKSCSGIDSYFVRGERFTKEEWEKEVDRIVKETCEEIKDKFLKLYVWAGVMKDKEFYNKIYHLDWQAGQISQVWFAFDIDVNARLHTYLKESGVK